MTAAIAPLRELETMGRENQLLEAAAVLDRLNHEFARIKVFLEESLCAERAR